MHMPNPHCSVNRDPRGVVRVTVGNAGPLNILGTAAINGVRLGLEMLATERDIRVLLIAGQSEKSMAPRSRRWQNSIRPPRKSSLPACAISARRCGHFLAELPLKQSVDLSVGVFGQSFLTGEPAAADAGFY